MGDNMTDKDKKFHYRTERKTKSITILVTPTEKKIIESLAKEKHLTISKLILSALQVIHH